MKMFALLVSLVVSQSVFALGKNRITCQFEEAPMKYTLTFTFTSSGQASTTIAFENDWGMGGYIPVPQTTVMSDFDFRYTGIHLLDRGVAVFLIPQLMFGDHSAHAQVDMVTGSGTETVMCTNTI